MRIAVLADAHGNAFGFHAALADARYERADRIVSAGDMLCSFPGGPQILQTLSSEQIPCVRGNADDLVLEWHRAAPASPLRRSPQFRPLQTACARFRPSDLERVQQWPLSRQFADGALVVCHGSPESNTHSIADCGSPPVSAQLAHSDTRAIVAGHYHHQWSERVDGRLLALAGSCGMPCADGTNAQYVLLDVAVRGAKDDMRVQHRSVAYDLAGFVAELRSHHYVERAGPVGWLELAQILVARPLMLYYFRDRFDPGRGTDLAYLRSSIRRHLEEYDALAAVEAVFGPLDISVCC